MVEEVKIHDPFAGGSIIGADHNLLSNRDSADAHSQYANTTITVAASNSSSEAQEAADYVCTGVADDIIINTAILDVVARGGGTVHLLEGLYTVVNPILLYDDIIFEGSGWSTIIYLADNIILDTSIFFNEDYINTGGVNGNRGIIVRNLQIDGNEDNQDQGLGGPDLYGIVFINCTGCIVDHVEITNVWTNGIAYGLCTECFTTNCYIHDLGGSGVAFNGSFGTNTLCFVSNNIIVRCTREVSRAVLILLSNNIQVSNNILSETCDENCLIWASSDCLFSTNICNESTADECVELADGGVGDCINIMVRDCILTNAYHDGINLRDCQLCHVEGNHVYLNAWNGIFVGSGSILNSITNNFVHSNNQNVVDPQFDNIRIDGAENLVLNNNTYLGVQVLQPLYGINIRAGAAQNYVTSNITINGGAMGGYIDNGTDTMPTWWEDINVDAFATGLGSNAPSEIAFLGAGGLKALGFPDGVLTKEIFVSFEIPHAYKEGRDIYIHVHWAPTTADAGSVVWQIEYSWANKDGVFPGSTTVPLTDVAAGTAWTHQMIESAVLASKPVSAGISSILQVRVFRDPTHASDNYEATAALLRVALHVPCDLIGSEQRLVKYI